MRANEFMSEEDHLNEVLPLVGLAARGAGGMLAKGAARMAQGAAGAAKKPFNSPQGQNNQQTMGAEDPAAPNTTPIKQAAIDQAKDQILKPGAEVNLATDGAGGPQGFKVSNVQGDNVEIENPNPGPGEPDRVVYKKTDLKKSMTL